MAVRVRVSLPATVTCSSCGGAFEVSQRHVRRQRAAGAEPRWECCRVPGRPLEPEERARLERWWRDRFSDDELAVMQCALRS